MHAPWPLRLGRHAYPLVSVAGHQDQTEQVLELMHD